ncbi:ABC-type hemin transport system, substrate-binding protein [Flavobacterium fluvii]|uniref:ABC-type hemin transport system, substrate-binding protein n=1 Tax=Flavobacterium fluvii TaxID=468056 RepID=A0A1M5HEJ5_9FLAO|nr:polysaccharide lyase family 8 super-sandwich domain-containing protein [Flavobacterium fluvii]SHG14351.1 ABC-type hemin transport system, substrate-binding protein [Flavobacterium fluvii]
MKTKLHVIFMLLLFNSFMPCAFATDYYTASANATLAGNTGAVNANWTTNPDGLTGSTSVTIAATDNLIILNGGTATVTATTSINNVTINTVGTINHLSGTNCNFTINGLFTWNGTIKLTNGGFFNVNGNIVGSTAIHDSNSTRGIYVGGTNKTISLTQLSTGVITNSSISVGILLNGASPRTLVGNCKLYSPLIFQATTCSLDLNGYNLQASSIKQGNSSTRLIKGNVNSKLIISGTSATSGTAATLITFDPNAAVLNELSVNSEYLATAAGPVTINGNLTVNSLTFGTASGDKATRSLQVNGSFTLANNGTMRVQAGGPTAVTTYDQLNATGNISIGSSTTLKVDFINLYTTSTQPFLTFAQSTSPGTVSGTFGTIQSSAGYTGNVTYTGNTVKYQILTTPAPAPPPPPCPISLNPDLPLVPSNAAVEAEIETIIQRFSDSYLGTAEPTTAALDAAVASYNALNISVDGYTITAGTAVTSYDQVAFLKTFAQYLKFHPEDTNNIFTKALNTVWLVSERVCKGTLALDYNQYSYRNFSTPAILIPRIKDNPHVKGLFENVLYQQNNFDYIWEPQRSEFMNVDLVGNTGVVTMAYVKWIDSADERYRYMTAFKRQMEKFMSFTPGTNDGLKPDGSAYHHWAAYPSYMYNLNSEASIVYFLRQTSFEVNRESYLRLRDAIMAQLMLTNDKTTRILTLVGRKPEEIATSISRFQFRDMAVAGGSILGTGASDPVMATYYNRVWGGYTPFGNSTKASFNEGYFQFNHSMAGVYRKDDWVVTCKGFNKSMFGTEIYPDANRFGRYQSYGAVNIVYDGDAATGNGYDYTTWNWNYNPGTTIIRLPWDKLHGERGNVDELQQKSFAGSLSFINKNNAYLKAIQGTYGMFAMDFQERTGLGFGTTIGPESHNSTFTFKKSVFTFDNMLICLGSGIGNNDAANTTLTTLYQRKAFAGKDQVNIDSNLLSTGSYDNSYDDTANHWIVDNYGTGFYVFAGSGTIKLTKADQQTPQHNQLWSAQNIANNPVGNYAIGYIDHGTTPSNKGYEYVCMPKTTATDMTTLGSQIDAGNKPYTVHRKDEMAHIVEYKPTVAANSIFGYAFFSALSGLNNTGQLTGADYPCLVMSQYDKAQKSLKLALTNPDLGFVYRQYNSSVNRQVNITVKGTNWQISQPNVNASITGTANGETIIQFTVVDGLPVEITLSRVLTSQTVTFEALPTKITTDAAFDLTATASSNLPVTYTSSNTDVATISGSNVTIVGKGTTIITAKQEGDDIYGAATAVEQTLTVNPAAQTITFDAIPVKAIGDAAFDLTAMASSNLPVSYTSSNTAVATISGSTVTIVGKGTATITAKQDGDDIYGAATAVEQTLTVNPAAQTITFDAIPVKAISDAAFDLTATASSNLPVSYTSSNTAVATISGSTVTIVGKGTTTITASQEGNNIYDVATAAEQILRVNTEATVSITSPLAAATYNALANITITVNATDADGNVSKVEFFNGTTKLGEDLTAPYSFDWNNVASGSYALTAKVTDNNDAVVTSTVVSVNVVCPTVQLSIPDVYAMNPAIDDKNTIYQGYGPTSLTLNSLVQGDQDFTYNWSTGAHTPSISVSQAGTYTVTVSYAGGCQSMASITINTLDVTCGNSNDRVMVCHNGKVICVAQSAVQAHLDHGDKLGSCDGTSKMAVKEEATNSSNFTVYPNPVQDNFNVGISSKLDPNATIGIYNIYGYKIRQVRFTAVPQNVYAGDLPSGNYIIVIQNGVETFRSTIVKQ